MATTSERPAETVDARPTATQLDPVTFEVLKNSFVNLVDQMSEQMLRTCYSFVIYARDFSNCLCDANGDTVMQGSQDIAVHVGTLHYSAKAVLDAFKDDLHPGDVVAVNDPYLGGTHFCDVRIIRPVFHEGQAHRPRADERALGRRRRHRPRLVRHHRQGALRGRVAHPARENLGQGRVPGRRGAAARQQHAPLRGAARRPARSGRSDPHRRGVSAAADRQVRGRHRRGGDGRVPGLRRAGHPRHDRRAADRAPGRRTTSSTSIRTRARGWSASTSN